MSSRKDRRVDRCAAALSVLLTAAFFAGLSSPPRAVAAPPASTIETGWLAGLVGRRHDTPPGCEAKPSARPPIADYPVCADQIVLLAEALDEARRSRRLLLIEFGATWCPSCRGLQHALRDPALLGADLASGTLSRDIVKVSIGLSMVTGGRMRAVDSGEAILTRLLASEPGVRMRAYPLIALINPDDASRAFVRNLDDIVLDGARVPAEPLARLLAAARDHLRAGQAVPTEPGWVMRKLSRLLQRIW